MSKFDSFWGGMDLDSSVAPAEEEKKTPEEIEAETEAAEAAKAKPPASEDEDETDEEKAAAKALADEAAKKPEEEEEELDFSEDDVSKAYTMLEEEGVLTLTEEDEFESSPKGLADAISATVRNKVNAQINDLPDDVKGLYFHLQEGKPLEDYVKAAAPSSWSEFDITEDDSKIAAIRAHLVLQGLDEEDIIEELEDIEVTGKMDKKAELALKALTKDEEVRTADKEKVKAARIKEAADEAKAEALQIQKTIDEAEEMAGFKLDDAKKQEFKDYLFKTNTRSNKTQMQENMADKNRRLRIAFLDFVDYTKADLEKSVKTELTKKRKKKLTKWTDKNAQGSNNSATVKTPKEAKKGKIAFNSVFGNASIEVEDD